MVEDLDKEQMEKKKRKYCKVVHGRYTICLGLLLLACMMLAIIGCILYKAQPKAAPQTVPEHEYVTMPPHGEHRQREYVNNTFIQMLHQHQLVVNVTDCWVCGLVPHSTGRGMPYLPLPFSRNGSAWAFYNMFKGAYLNTPKQALNAQFGPQKKAVINGILTMMDYHGHNNTGTPDEREKYDQWNSTYYVTSFKEKERSKKPQPDVWVVPHQGNLCLQGKGWNNKAQLGTSKCKRTYAFSVAASPPLVTAQGTYFVCGDKAHTWLPANFSGTCYVAFLLPPTYTATATHHRLGYRIRNKRGVLGSEDTAGQEAGDFFKGFIPFWGPMVNSREISYLSKVVKATINETAGTLSNITAEVQADRLMTLQNRMVLDIILADRGGVCKLIGYSCCVYIPDNAPTVYKAIQKLHKIAETIHTEEGTWSLTGWFWSMLSQWGWKILTFLGIIMAMLFACCLCIQCGPAICGLCATALAPKPINIKAQNARISQEQEIHELMQIRS